jgi:hypothetical protein
MLEELQHLFLPSLGLPSRQRQTRREVLVREIRSQKICEGVKVESI